MAWHGGHVGFNELQKRLNKPKLIKETTRPENMWQMIVGKNLEENRLDEFVWPDGLQTRLEYLIEQTLQANEAESSFKNVLLYGPPGTGKTMFAKSLARASGVHYAMFSGADFNNFESLAEAQAELDNIITWGENSDKGIIIFVDEADCFLVERTFPDTTPRQCALTNMFLSRVEKPSSNKIMWVFCTNNRGSLDIAVESRISEAYEFKRPSDKNGMQILLQYLEQKDVLLTEAIKKEIVKISSNLVGLSGRDIQEIAEEIARRLNINNITLDFDLIKTAIEEKKDNLTAMAQAQAEYRRARYNRT
jgi:ATPase family AAA domain-containing protein 3A/B